VEAVFVGFLTEAVNPAEVSVVVARENTRGVFAGGVFDMSFTLRGRSFHTGYFDSRAPI